MSTNTFPRRATIQPVATLEEFMAKWDSKLDNIIRSFRLHEYTDDLKQIIYTRIFEDDGLNRYDPKKGSFSTFVYALVLTILQNARKQYLRERATMPVSFDALAFDDGYRQDTPERGRFSAQKIASLRVDEEKSRDFHMQLRIVREALRRLPVRSFFYFNGEAKTRNLATLFELIMEGKSREEICQELQYSTGSVGIMYDELRKVPEVLDLRELWEQG
jgi:hypothetical protein